VNLKIFSFFILFFLSFFTSAEDKLLKVAYFKDIYGHIHQNPQDHSKSFSTISCGHPIKVLIKKEKNKSTELFNKQWRYVKAGPYKGYIRDNLLLDSKPNCPQEMYSQFFDELKLEISDFYYWGKLYDNYLKGKSKVR